VFQAAIYVLPKGSLKRRCFNIPKPVSAIQVHKGSLKMKPAPILATLLAACGIAPQTAQPQNFSALRVQVANTPDGSIITLTGLLNDSALGIRNVRISSDRQQQTARIIVQKKLASSQHTGQLNARFVLDHPVERIQFGADQQTIWTAD
jgi:hypothetical protein